MMAIKLTFEVIPEEVNDGVRVTASGYGTSIAREVNPEIGKIGPDVLTHIAQVFTPRFEASMKAAITRRIEEDFASGGELIFPLGLIAGL
jgi:hypothetical protein